jgi:hypothetical protein
MCNVVQIYDHFVSLFRDKRQHVPSAFTRVLQYERSWKTTAFSIGSSNDEITCGPIWRHKAVGLGNQDASLFLSAEFDLLNKVWTGALPPDDGSLFERLFFFDQRRLPIADFSEPVMLPTAPPS